MVLLDILEEHLDEATFHWEQWERALVAPDFTLAETAEREERLLAHLEGLEDEAATDTVLRPAFESEEPYRVGAAAHALLAQGAMDEVLVRFREASPEVRVGIRRALEVSEAPDLGARLLSLLKREDTDLQAQVLEALAFRQEAPPEVLARFFIHEEPQARRVALRAIPVLSEDSTRRLLPALLDSAHPGIRAAAMEAGVASGVRLAWDACRKAVRSGQADSAEALVLLACGGDDADTALLMELLKSVELRPQVLWALGFNGRVAAMEACVEYLREPSVARLAGEALSAMTGLRLEGALALPPGERPPGAPLPPELEEDLDANLVPTPEDDLPWPHVAAVSAWWADARKRFERDTLKDELAPLQKEIAAAETTGNTAGDGRSERATEAGETRVRQGRQIRHLHERVHDRRMHL